LRVLLWNVHGKLQSKIRKSELGNMLKKHDLCLLHETHLQPNQHLTLRLPSGYTVLARSRPLRHDGFGAGGGVAAIYRTELRVTERNDLVPKETPDIQVLEIGDLIVVSAYIAPETSRWREWTEVEPMQRLVDSLALCSAHMNRRILVLGDFNARTRSEQAPAASIPMQRSSSDERPPDARGRRLLAAVADCGLVILNGTQMERDQPGRMTSFQGKNGEKQAVVDYVLASADSWSSIRHLHVSERPDRLISDHAALSLHVDLNSGRDAAVAAAQSKARGIRRDDAPRVLGDQFLDGVLERTLAARQSPEEALDALYGTCVHGNYTWETVWTDGSCVDVNKPYARAGAGIYWRDARDRSLRVPGPQTNNSAELYAIWEALRYARHERALHIFTDSTYAIGEICHYAHKRAAEGWRSANGALLRAIVALLQTRRLPVKLSWVRGHTGDAGNEAADRLAKAGCEQPPRDDHVTGEPQTRIPGPPRGEGMVPKVQSATDFRAVPERKDDRVEEHGERSNASEADEEHDQSEAHRGRAREEALHRDNAAKLVEASKSEAGFWKLIRDWLDAQASAVGADRLLLHESLKRRMTQQPRSGDEYETEHLRRIAGLANAIPLRTFDRTAEQIFSRPFTEEDMQELKAHIKEHRAASARGADDVGYTDVLTVPNDALCELFNSCARHAASPGAWLTTLIIGLLKPGKPASDPEGYRLIAFESCVLKCMTLLFLFRAREWADAYCVIPDSQNGFRQGYRTNNNAYVLRCVIDRASADGQTLYTAFVDFTNAFPSTDLPTLWFKLYSKGMSGPLFDWVRNLYASMRYTTALGGEFSDPFQSDIGVLTGDTASPFLFLVYLADFETPVDTDDISLAGRRISHLEQADDMVLFSTTARGLQSKLDALVRWCRRNGIRMSIPKTKCTAYAVHPRVMPIFRAGQHVLPTTDAYVYVGVTFRSKSRYLNVSQHATHI
jgi:ribonuclease HI/exonuclease III